MGLQASLCPNAREPDRHPQDDRPVKKQISLPKGQLPTRFRNRCTDSIKGCVRSSYFYNPQVMDAANGNYLRRYQKSSQFEGHRLFGCDVITQLRPDYTAHLQDIGYCVLFTDGAAKFVKSDAAFDAVAQMHQTASPGGSVFGTPEELDNVFNLLEQ